MSLAFMAQFSLMLDQFKIVFNNSLFQAVLGYRGIRLAKPSLRPSNVLSAQRAKILRFQDDVEDTVPHRLGLAHSGDSSLARPQLGADTAHSRDPPTEANGKEWRPADPSGPRVCFAQPIVGMHSILRPLWSLG